MKSKKNIVRYYLEVDQESNSVDITDVNTGETKKFDSIFLICGNSLTEKLFSMIYGHSEDVARGLAGIYKTGQENNSKPIKDIFSLFIRWVALHLRIDDSSLNIENNAEEIEAVLNKWEKEDKEKEEENKKKWN